MNTCARLEGTSRPNQIHCSKATAEQLIECGKAQWVKKRSDTVELKGLGSQETFWVNVRSDQSVASGHEGTGEQLWHQKSVVMSSEFNLDERTLRLIDWNVEMLSRMMREIGARRMHRASRKSRGSTSFTFQSSEMGPTPLEEVREIIALPEFNVKASVMNVEPQNIVIPQNVTDQLRHLVSAIAGSYNDNPFHSFDHASRKLTCRVKSLGHIHSGSSAVSHSPARRSQTLSCLSSS